MRRISADGIQAWGPLPLPLPLCLPSLLPCRVQQGCAPRRTGFRIPVYPRPTLLTPELRAGGGQPERLHQGRPQRDICALAGARADELHGLPCHHGGQLPALPHHRQGTLFYIPLALTALRPLILQEPPPPGSCQHLGLHSVDSSLRPGSLQPQARQPATAPAWQGPASPVRVCGDQLDVCPCKASSNMAQRNWRELYSVCRGLSSQMGEPVLNAGWAAQVVAPESCRKCYSERLALMPNCYFVNDYKQAHLVRARSAAPRTQHGAACTSSGLPGRLRMPQAPFPSCWSSQRAALSAHARQWQHSACGGCLLPPCSTARKGCQSQEAAQTLPAAVACSRTAAEQHNPALPQLAASAAASAAAHDDHQHILHTRRICCMRPGWPSAQLSGALHSRPSPPAAAAAQSWIQRSPDPAVSQACQHCRSPQ